MTDRPVDPTGKRALFSASVEGTPEQPATEQTATEQPATELQTVERNASPDSGGRAALFSTPPRRAGTVIVECSDCKVRSRVSLAGLGVRLASGSAWVPLGRYQHWVRCPSCGQRRWCRIGWRE
ncbi:MAG TPA: hypothetical protein VFV02_00880 [Acidimicrobiales bacterium]|nr:hypothetical protein [Acidimicrobiales bacterium]